MIHYGSIVIAEIEFNFATLADNIDLKFFIDSFLLRLVFQVTLKSLK